MGENEDKDALINTKKSAKDAKRRHHSNKRMQPKRNK